MQSPNVIFVLISVFSIQWTEISFSEMQIIQRMWFFNKGGTNALNLNDTHEATI